MYNLLSPSDFGFGTQSLNFHAIDIKYFTDVDTTTTNCLFAGNYQATSANTTIVATSGSTIRVTITGISVAGCWRLYYLNIQGWTDEFGVLGRIFPPMITPNSVGLPISSTSVNVTLLNLSQNPMENNVTLHMPNNGGSFPVNCSRVLNGTVGLVNCPLPAPITSLGYLEATFAVGNGTSNRTVVGIFYKYVTNLKPQIAFSGVPTRAMVQGPNIQESDKYILTSATSCTAASANSAFCASAGSQPLTFSSKSDIRGCFCKYVAGVTDCTQITHFVETGPLGTLYVRSNSSIVTSASPRMFYTSQTTTFTLDLSAPIFTSLFDWAGLGQPQDPMGQLSANVSPLSTMIGLYQASQNTTAVLRGPFAMVPALTCAGASSYSNTSAQNRLIFFDIHKISFAADTGFGPQVYPHNISFCVCFEGCDQDSSWILQTSVPPVQFTKAVFVEAISPVTLGWSLVNITGSGFGGWILPWPSIRLPNTENWLGIFEAWNYGWLNQINDNWIIIQFFSISFPYFDFSIARTFEGLHDIAPGNTVHVYTAFPIADSVQVQFDTTSLNITGRYFSTTPDESVIYFAPESRYSGTCTVAAATETNLLATCTRPFDRIMKLWVEDTRCATPLDGPNGRKYAFLKFPSQASVITSISPTQATVGSGNISITLSGPNASQGYAFFVTLDHACYDSFSSFTPRPLAVVNSAFTVWPRLVGQYQLCFCSSNTSGCNSSTNYFPVKNIRLTILMGSNVATSLQGPSTLPPTSFNGQTATILLSSLLPQDLRCAQSSSLTPSLPPLTFWTRNSTQCDLSSQFWLPYSLCNATNSGALMIPAPGALGDLQIGLYRLCMCVGECKTSGDFAIQSGVSISTLSVWESTYTPQLTSFHPDSPFRISLESILATAAYTCELNSAGGEGLVLTAGRIFRKKGKFVFCSDWRGKYRPHVAWTLVVKENGLPLQPPSGERDMVFQSLPFVSRPTMVR